MATAEVVRAPILHAPTTGDELVDQWRGAYPRELAAVPFYCLNALVAVTDAALLDARTRRNVPRHPIPEDAKRGGADLPKR